MKPRVLTLCCFLATLLPLQAQLFEDFFLDKTMRFDYFRCGNAESETIYFDKIKEEPYWGGSKTNLTDKFDYGNHRFRIIDMASGKLIYSRGYCSLFKEWQATEEAHTTPKCYPEGVTFPYPKQPVKIVLDSRNKKGEWEERFEYTIQPDSYTIQKLKPLGEAFDVVVNGDPQHCVDVVLIAEGYSTDEREAFEEACRYFAEQIFSFSPYKENKQKFNIRGVWIASPESGVSKPRQNEWKNTAVSAKFNTLDIERYQMIDNLQPIKDLAAAVPYDIIYILTNTDRYGGGGIYNFYGISSAQQTSSTGKVYIHELSHLLTGLADEYVGGTETNEFYPLQVEPWEANLTTLTDFDKKEWKKMLKKDTPIPTPADKTNTDRLGVYEGGGYLQKGIYRPYIHCLMNHFQVDYFCPVCTKAITEMITFHCQ